MMNKRLGWTVAHTANSKVELIAEDIVKAFLEKNWAQMMGTTDIEVEDKDAKKVIKSWKSCEVMLVWSEDEASLQS